MLVCNLRDLRFTAILRFTVIIFNNHCLHSEWWSYRSFIHSWLETSLTPLAGFFFFFSCSYRFFSVITKHLSSLSQISLDPFPNPPPHSPSWRRFCHNAPKLFSDHPSQIQLFLEPRIDSYSKLTQGWSFESLRLTLLWSQSTTGDYFEEKNASSIEFHFRKSGQKRVKLLEVLNWCKLNNKSMYMTCHFCV